MLMIVVFSMMPYDMLPYHAHVEAHDRATVAHIIMMPCDTFRYHAHARNDGAHQQNSMRLVAISCSRSSCIWSVGRVLILMIMLLTQSDLGKKA